jgi:hypothetical protein
MSNTIWIKRMPEIDLRMNNGLTSAFINTFGLSGSRLAKTEQEKRLIVHILEKNQSVLGVGNVGFDLGWMPWNNDNFENDKKFILSVLNGIINKIGWENLGYSPREEMIYRCVNTFEKMLLNMAQNDIDIEKINGWLKEKEPNDPINNNFPLCPIHNVLLTIYGCQVCTD